MKDPNEFVKARTKDGAVLYRARRTAKALGLTIDENARAVDNHGRPLPDKPKQTSKSAPTTPAKTDKPKEN